MATPLPPLEGRTSLKCFNFVDQSSVRPLLYCSPAPILGYILQLTLIIVDTLKTSFSGSHRESL